MEIIIKNDKIVSIGKNLIPGIDGIKKIINYWPEQGLTKHQVYWDVNEVKKKSIEMLEKEKLEKKKEELINKFADDLKYIFYEIDNETIWDDIKLAIIEAKDE